MKKKAVKRVKHTPQRTCIGCRETLPKRNLIRLVRTSSGIHVDLSGKAPGRGAYLHDQRSCWERALKGALAQSLKQDLTEQDRLEISAFLSSLPEETPTQAN